jgi:hypothetical protein
MTGPIVLGPGQGDALQARGSLILFKAVAATTGGAFSLHERHLPPGGRKPPPHRHTDCQEAFFVLDGEVEFTLGAETVRPAMDQYFRELEALWAGPEPPDREAELDLMRRHGMTPG